MPKCIITRHFRVWQDEVHTNSQRGTDPLRQLASGQQPVVLDHVALGMHPFGFDGIEPGTLGGNRNWEVMALISRLVYWLLGTSVQEIAAVRTRESAPLLADGGKTGYKAVLRKW